MKVVDVWQYRDETWGDASLEGFGVEAIDGSIGKIDRASAEVGSSRIVVDTGPWIFGKKVMLPAGVIDRVDLEDEKVFVNRSRTRSRTLPSTTSTCSRMTRTGARSARTTGRVAPATGTGTGRGSKAPPGS